MMRSFLITLVATMIVSTAVQAGFVAGLEDIPLPENVRQIENGTLNFGNEEIRLIETYLQSESGNFENIAGFYCDSLPQLGWRLVKTQKDNLVFERESESLQVEKESNKPLIVRLTVKSKP